MWQPKFAAELTWIGFSPKFTQHYGEMGNPMEIAEKHNISSVSIAGLNINK